MLICVLIAPALLLARLCCVWPVSLVMCCSLVASSACGSSIDYLFLVFCLEGFALSLASFCSPWWAAIWVCCLVSRRVAWPWWDYAFEPDVFLSALFKLRRLGVGVMDLLADLMDLADSPGLLPSLSLVAPVYCSTGRLGASVYPDALLFFLLGLLLWLSSFGILMIFEFFKLFGLISFPGLLILVT